ncbi:hypothetical protein LIER_26525 [Lithospermum erythrorhizon]|uniref:Uncharacterized protein n=1 Tax=Lithospermum erythrorhizon TaxID=34254 RepID=A0AAV3R8N7_LITER
MKKQQSKYEFYTDFASSYVPAMMTGATTLEEQVASLAKVIENITKQVQREDDSLSHIAGKIIDHDQRAQETEVSLKELSPQETPNPSKTTPETLQTSPQ